MVAEAQDLILHIRQIDGQIIGVGAVAGVGLEEFVPDQNAVLVAQLVEVLVGALANPVADHVHVGERVHVNLSVEPSARNALHAFVETPIAAADEDFHAVDGNGERVHAAVGDFANAEHRVVRVGVFAVLNKM